MSTNSQKDDLKDCLVIELFQLENSKVKGFPMAFLLIFGYYK